VILKKLGLGTVQFGLKYGVSNPTEQKTPANEVSKILEIAAENQIQVLDTAHDYGESESVLGTTLPQNHPFKIITKISKLSGGFKKIPQTFLESLTRLKQPFVEGLLVHHAKDLIGEKSKQVYEALLLLKEKKLVKKIGVSVYEASEIESILDQYPIDLIQVPLNIFDQRLLKSGHLDEFKKRDIEVHVRSMFLQGLLLVEVESLPACFNSRKANFKKFHMFLAEQGISPLQACLQFVLQLPQVDIALCGVNDSKQLLEICKVAENPKLRPENFLELAIDDPMVLNPSNWKFEV